MLHTFWGESSRWLLNNAHGGAWCISTVNGKEFLSLFHPAAKSNRKNKLETPLYTGHSHLTTTRKMILFVTVNVLLLIVNERILLRQNSSSLFCIWNICRSYKVQFVWNVYHRGGPIQFRRRPAIQRIPYVNVSS